MDIQTPIPSSNSNNNNKDNKLQTFTLIRRPLCHPIKTVRISSSNFINNNNNRRPPFKSLQWAADKNLPRLRDPRTAVLKCT